jgi:GNAT superfamily N-acetyltransferase
MRIREATFDDARAIAQLAADVQELHFENRPDWFKPPNTKNTIALYEGFLQDPAITAYLAESDEGALGFVLFRVIHRPDTPLNLAQTIVDIEQIGVAPSARRRGVGHDLIEAVRQLAHEVSATLIHLTTWEFNSGAQSFFETEGFSPEMRRMSMMLSNL